MSVCDRTILVAVTDVRAAAVLGTIFQLHKANCVILGRGLRLLGFLCAYS